MCEGRTTVLHFASFVVLAFGAMATGGKRGLSLTEVVSSDEASCHNFSVGDPHRREFYSPNYPAHYPKNIKCTLRITAYVDHQVMLDFRDHFRLEHSPTCEYDRLEIRDGAHGYSPLLGQFCGSEFPRQLYSSRRYMWLQFASDDSIEYGGFRAVYDYVPVKNPLDGNDDKECAFHRSGSSGLIDKSEIEQLYKKYKEDDIIECMWTIETEAGKQLYMNFKRYKLDKPNDCDQNFLQLFSDGRTPDKQLSKFCGTTAEPQKSPSNVTHVRLVTHYKAFNGTDFALHYTAFRELRGKEDQCDPHHEFNCGDGTCVDISLKCDGEYDCKYRYDEEPTLCTRALGAGMVLTSEHMIVILVVFFSLVVAMCASISVSCWNKVRERRLREREYKERRSKEASVEVALSSYRGGAKSADRMADDESSDGGCYVPEADFGKPNGGDTIPKKLLLRQQQQQQPHYPYVSESFESLASDVIVPPAPPPVPHHRRDPSPPSYKIVAGAGKPLPSTLSRPPQEDPKAAWLRGPLEGGAPRGPLGAKYGGARVTPRGPVGSAFKELQGGAPARIPYHGGDASDSSRAQSAASALSAPDALPKQPR